MSVPVQQTTIAADAGALLTTRYVSQKVVPGIVKALTLRLQQIENSFYDLLNDIQLSNHPLPGGPWSILDQIGAIVGVSRAGLVDADYLALIKIQAFANRARGLSEDILRVAMAMAAGTPVVYHDMPTASFYLGVWNIALKYPLFEPILAQVRAAGVYGLFHYSTWADGNDFEYSSRYDATAGQGMWGSRYDGTAGGLLVAAVPL